MAQSPNLEPHSGPGTFGVAPHHNNEALLTASTRLADFRRAATNSEVEIHALQSLGSVNLVGLP